jgi:glutathione S-transferase
MNAMKLYYSPGACALSPQIALREAGLAFDLVKVDLKTKKTEDGGDFLAVNPKGQVPTLVTDDGLMLTEGPAIVQWVADHSKAAQIAPAKGTQAHYKLLELLNYITSELHKSLGSLFNPAMPEDYRAFVKEGLLKKYAFVDGLLAKTPYLLGDTFTVADGYLFNVTRWAGYAAIQLDLSGFKNLQAFNARMRERPSVQAAVAAEGIPL